MFIHQKFQKVHFPSNCTYNIVTIWGKMNCLGVFGVKTQWIIGQKSQNRAPYAGAYWGRITFFYIYILFYATQFWIVSTSNWTLDVTLSINFKKYFAEAFFFFLPQKSLQLFIDSLRQSFLQYCWSPFGFWNTHPHWILRASSYSVYWALQDDLKKLWQNAFFFFFSSFDKSLQLFIDSLRQRFL